MADDESEESPQGDGEERAGPISVGVTKDQREQIRRNAANYAANLGRPVALSEFMRDLALEPVEIVA